MKQVSFAGSHSDVGGGYPEPQLSDITLEWMVCEATGVDHGLRIQAGHGVQLAPDAAGTMHDPCARGPARLYRRERRCWPTGFGQPTLHQTVFDRASLSGYDPWILRDFADRCQVEPWSRWTGT